MKHFIITGKKHAGKTTYTAKLIELLKNKDYMLYGFLNIGTFKDNVRDKFFIKSVHDNKEILFAERSDKSNGLTFCSYNFYEDGFNAAEEEYNKGLKNKSDFIVIDEVGKWELEQKGFFYLFNKMPVYSSIIIVCRDDFKDDINKLIFNSLAEIIYIDEDVYKISEKIMKTYKETVSL